MKTTKWAVVGPGFIAGRFAQGMLEAPGAERTAVVSRSEEKYGFAFQILKMPMRKNTGLLLLIPILKKCSRDRKAGQPVRLSSICAWLRGATG